MRTILIVAIAVIGTPVGAVAQSRPANVQGVATQQGAACERGFLQRAHKCVAVADATDDEIRQYLIASSIAAYPGNCPCPYNADRAGRRCGRRSAYSRAGGHSPLCFPADVSDDAVRRERLRHKPVPR